MYESASDEFAKYMRQGHYFPSEGSIVPFAVFVSEFAKWLACPARQLHWLQNRRVETALLRAGYPIGRVVTTAIGKQRAADIYVGNMGGFRASSLSNRAIVLDDELEWLAPRDLRPGERP